MPVKSGNDMGGLPSIGLVSLGCAKNLVDSERLLGHLAAAGFPVAMTADVADVLIVNTCAFIGDATAESEEQIRRCLGFRDGGGAERVIVVGCLPLRGHASDLLARADAVFGSGEHEAVERFLKSGSRVPARPALVRHCMEGGRFRLTPAHFAYLRVSEGCDNRCSYCMIPSIRGPQSSKSLADLTAEAGELALSGASEIALIGQDVAAWGRDAGGAGLPGLLRSIEGVRGLRRVMMLYLHPAHLGMEVVDAAAAGSAIAPYFDIPMQHADADLLAAMNRKHGPGLLRDLVSGIRRRIPHAALRTTFIVGFPGETEAAFQRLLDFVEWARFDRVGAFAYSSEAGTPAAGLPGQISESEKQRRLGILLGTASRISREKSEEMLGREFEVVVDRESASGRGVFECRSFREAFDADPVILVRKKGLTLGLWGLVRITGVKDLDLRGVWLKTI